jgi:hypothetical protein
MCQTNPLQNHRLGVCFLAANKEKYLNATQTLLNRIQHALAILNQNASSKGETSGSVTHSSVELGQNLRFRPGVFVKFNENVSFRRQRLTKQNLFNGYLGS